MQLYQIKFCGGGTQALVILTGFLHLFLVHTSVDEPPVCMRMVTAQLGRIKVGKKSTFSQSDNLQTKCVQGLYELNINYLGYLTRDVKKMIKFPIYDRKFSLKEATKDKSMLTLMVTQIDIC